MADATKYKSISLPIAAYNKLKKHCRAIADFDGVPLSITQTIQHHILLADDYLNERELPKDCYHLRTKPFVSNETKKDWIVGTNLDDKIHTGSLKQIKQNLEIMHIQDTNFLL